jgi:hypothetical protein
VNHRSSPMRKERGSSRRPFKSDLELWNWRQRANSHLSSLWHAFTEDFELDIAKIGMERHGHVLCYVCGLQHCHGFWNPHGIGLRSALPRKMKSSVL